MSATPIYDAMVLDYWQTHPLIWLQGSTAGTPDFASRFVPSAGRIWATPDTRMTYGTVMA